MIRAIAALLVIGGGLYGILVAGQIWTHHSTVISPFSRGWYLQWYLYLPFFLNVNL